MVETPPPDDPDIPEKEPVDPALIQKAFAVLRRLAAGNGLKPESLSLGGFEGEILNFEASLVFKIEKTVAEKRAAGKVSGESAGSAIDARQKIDAAIARLSKDREIRKHTILILKKRPDLGYAVPGLVIRFDKHNQRFVIHEKCVQCAGAGTISCGRCHGRKELPCPKCHGKQSVMCHICRGSKTVFVQGKKVPCRQCGGDGLVNCPVCRRKGRIMCSQCRGVGHSQCTQCAASGWKSQIFMASIKAKTRFDFDRAALPEEVPPLIDSYGPALLLDGHAEIRIIEDVKKDAEMEALAKPGEYIIPYHVRLPWGDMSVSVENGEPMEAKLFGGNGLLLNVPPFLEKPGQKALWFLTEAVQGKGPLLELAHKALRWRFTGEAFLFLLSGSRQKAMEALQERYPYGFTEEFLSKTLLLADETIRRATVRARFGGLGAGLGVAALLYGALLFTPLSLKAAALPPFMPDIIAVLAGGALAAAGAYQGERRALRKLLAPLLKTRKAGENGADGRIDMGQRRIESALWGGGGALILYVFLAGVAAFGGGGPSWAQALRHLLPS